MPQIEYPLKYSDDPSFYYNEKEETEINKNVIEPFLNYMDSSGYKVIKIEIGIKQDNELTIYTILFNNNNSQFDRYSFSLKKQNGSIPFLKEIDLQPGPGYRG